MRWWPGSTRKARLTTSRSSARTPTIGRAGSAGFELALDKRGKKLVMADYFQKGTADYTAVLTKIKAKKPGMLAFYLIDADFQNGIKQWFTMGGGIPLTGRVLVEQVPKEILASGFLDGTTAVQPYDVSVDTPANKAFVEAFTKRNSEAPMLISFESYETINILIEAIRQSGDASPEKIRDALTQHQVPVDARDRSWSSTRTT